MSSSSDIIYFILPRDIYPHVAAVRIYGLLIKCQHPHCLKPTGLWICHNDKDEGSGKEGVRADEAFITFPPIDGLLVDVPTEDLFLLEKGSPQSNPSADDAKKEEGSPKPTAHEPTVDDIKNANWAAIGTCLSTICRSCDVKLNMELEHFVNKLSEKSKKGPMLNYNDIVWEPGLWPAHIKINFIREVFWCIDNSKAKEEILKSKNSLGLKGCILKLGFDNNDANLLDSVIFLRKKVVAHQDSSYESYTGDKGHVGSDKTTIEAFIKKNKPDYMINLAKEAKAHQLGTLALGEATTKELVNVRY
uniref:Uncharacterized protein n=1 Tax=Oryza punctata TaxID=4537 RepID=A0A0E0MFT4_ORYPU